MKYHIEYEGKIIASFVNKADRDICMDALIENFSDCEELFKAIDGDE